jgi:glycosyltransferase involved in cell wall biosynthesis
MKRLCMLRHHYYPDINPNQRNAEALLAHGYKVEIICLRKKGTKSHEVISGVGVHRLPLEHHRKGALRYAGEYAAFFFMATWKLAWMSLRKRYDVVEVSGIPDFMVFAAIFPKLLGAKIVFHVLDHTPGVFADHFKFGAGHPITKILNLIERLSAHWADHIITTQSTSQEMLVRSGISASKISVILNTPDEDVFNHQPSTNVDGNRFSLVTHGSLVERYRVQVLIKAVPLLLKDIPELKVKIIGDGEYQPALEELAQSLGVSQYINFTGRVPFKEIPAHIARAHVGIVAIPTGVNPAMPQKLLEYMALGKPAVVTSFPTIRAYFDDSMMMFYEPDDEHDLARCVLELYRNPEKRAALSKASVAVYQKYKWSKMKHKYLKVFDDLTKKEDKNTPAKKGTPREPDVKGH